MDNLTDYLGANDVLEPPDYTIILLYVIVFIWAMVANIIVIFVVIKYKHMWKATNYFLVNLTVADLLVALICMPNAIYPAYTGHYFPGKYMCKGSGYLQCILVASSIFTITAMAMDRYIAICNPFAITRRSLNKTTVFLIVLIWFIPMVLFSPQYMGIIYEHVIYDNITIYLCKENPEGYFIPKSTLGITWFIFMFVVPAALMTFAYSMMGRTLCSVAPPFDNNEGMSSTLQRNRLIRSRRRIAIILLLLALVFALCWLPYHIVNLLIDVNVMTTNQTRNIRKYLLLLGHTNSALNPVIYCALSRIFRDSIKDLFLVRLRFRRNRTLMHVDSTASATQLHYLQRLKSVSSVNNHAYFGISRLSSSQNTTRTCAV